MLQTTPGIVLHSIKYGDTSLITRILTPRFGVQSYMVQGVRKTKARTRASLFQPLTLLELVVYHKERTGLQHIREVRCTYPLAAIGNDIRKNAIALFMSEVLHHALRNQEPHPEAFDFVYNAVVTLDNQQENLATFHIVFLLQLARFLGFAPATNFSESHCYFNLQEGVYQKSPGLQSQSLTSEESMYFFRLTQASLSDNPNTKIPSSVRRSLLLHTINYYRYHIEGFAEVKSVDVLEQIFH